MSSSESSQFLWQPGYGLFLALLRGLTVANLSYLPSFRDKSPAGVFLSVWIYIVYQVAVTFEEYVL
jgi:hypothetical protein